MNNFKPTSDHIFQLVQDWTVWVEIDMLESRFVNGIKIYGPERDKIKDVHFFVTHERGTSKFYENLEGVFCTCELDL